MLRTLTIALSFVLLTASGARSDSLLVEPRGDGGWARRILAPVGPSRAAELKAAAAGLSESELSRRGDALLDEHRSTLFGPNRAEHPTLREERVRHSRSGHQIFRRQTVRGIPVEGGEVVVALDLGGRMLSIVNSAIPGLRLDDPRPELSPEAAIRRALQPLGGDILPQLEPSAELVVLPDRGGLLAYRVDAPLNRPYLDLRAYVDARTGELIRSDDLAIHEKPVAPGYSVELPMRTATGKDRNAAKATGSGLVFPANPLNDHPERYHLRDGDPSMDDFRESKALERLEDTGLLRGLYVDVDNLDQERANEPTLIFEYSSLVDNGPFQEVNSYWHVDVFQHYIKTVLGIDGAKDVPQWITVHGQEDDNSTYFAGASQRIDLGDGGVDDSDDGEIVIHEYGHAIHDYISGIDGNVHENLALSEGFGDYLGASFGGNPFVGEWDATSYSSETPPNLRRTDGNKVYPTDMINQVHADGEIISAAWWEMYEALGKEAADQLIIEAFFLFPGNGGFIEFADATLLVDQSINGGANIATITEAYANHGIIPRLGITVEHTPLADTFKVGPYSVQATVRATLNLRENDPVELHYRILDDTAFTRVSMSPVTSVVWSAEIPDPAAPTADIEYFLQVYPESGDPIRSPETGVHGFSLTPPPIMALDQNIPNPFRLTTSIAFALPTRGRTSLRVYDLAGRLVRELLNVELAAGVALPVVWNGKDHAGKAVGSGVYFYELTQGSRSETRKMILLR